MKVTREVLHWELQPCYNRFMAVKFMFRYQR